MRDLPFTKFQQFDLSIRRMLTSYKSYFIGKENNFFKIEHYKDNNIPFEL